MPIAAMDARHPPAQSRTTLRRAWTLAWIAAAIAIVVYGCLTWRLDGQVLARGPDQADMQLAFFHQASHAIARDGLLAAMYDPTLRAGWSQWSNPNYHVLYPLFFNWAGADASLEATLDRLDLISRLHLALLAAGTFLLARMLGVRTAFAVAAALVIPWLPAMRSAAGWSHIMAGLSWIPWILAAQVALLRSRDWAQRAVAATVLAASASLLVYAQPAQNLVQAIFASAVLCALAGGAAALYGDTAERRRLGASLVALVAAGVAVALVTGGYVLELASFHAGAIRWLGAVGGSVTGHGPLPVEALRFHALPGAEAGKLLAFELRRGIGHPWMPPLVLAAAASVVFLRGTDARTQAARALLACGALSLLFCFAFMAPLLVHVPLVGRVRELTWWSCLAVVCLVPLAALGLQALCTAGTDARDAWLERARFGVFAAVAVLAVVAIAVRAPALRIESLALLAIGFGAAAAMAWLSRGEARRRHGATATALGIVALLSCAWIPIHHNLRFERAESVLFAPDRVQARADAAALRARTPDAADWRLLILAGDQAALSHSWSTSGWRVFGGGLGPADARKFALLGAPSPPVAALYGARYVLVDAAGARTDDASLRPGLSLRVDPAARPWLVFATGGVRVVDDPVAQLLATPHDALTKTLVAAADLPEGLDAARAVATPLRAVPLTADVDGDTRVIATVDADVAGLVVLNEDPDARWHATVDGSPVATLRVNGFQTAVPVAAGRGRVVRIERPGAR